MRGTLGIKVATRSAGTTGPSRCLRLGSLPGSDRHPVHYTSPNCVGAGRCAPHTVQLFPMGYRWESGREQRGAKHVYHSSQFGSGARSSNESSFSNGNVIKKFRCSRFVPGWRPMSGTTVTTTEYKPRNWCPASKRSQHRKGSRCVRWDSAA